MSFESLTIHQPDSFEPFEYPTSPVFGLHEVHFNVSPFQLESETEIRKCSKQRKNYVCHHFPPKNFFVTLSSTNFTKLEKQKTAQSLPEIQERPTTNYLYYS